MPRSVVIRMCTAAVVSVLLASPLAAQDWQRSALVGRVFDASGQVIAGARVTLSGTGAVGGPVTAQTDASGKYRFGGLLPGTYTVAVGADGFKHASRDGVDLPVETTYTVDFRLDVASIAERVDVVASPWLIDVTTAATPLVVSQSLLQDLPTARTMDGVLALAPGVTNGVAFGGTQRSNLITIDGVSLNDPYLGDQWVETRYTWNEQIQVVALGAGAQYGGFTGAVANGVLRSGSNRYSGLGEFLAVRPSWTGDNTRSMPEGPFQPTPATILTRWDAGAQIGGPIVRDRLWFFGGIGRERHDYRLWGYDGPGSSDRSVLQGIVKLDGAPRSDMRVQGFYEQDRSTVLNQYLSVWYPLGVASDYRARNRAWNAHATWMARATTMIEVRLSGAGGPHDQDPHPPNTNAGPPAHVDYDTGATSGNAVGYVHDRRSSTRLAATATQYADQFAGSHEFKFGVEIERTATDIASGYNGGLFYYDIGGEPYLAFIWDGSRERTTSRRTSAFAQDAWRVGSRVTVEPGVRIDAHRGSVPGKGTVFSTTTVSPRIGVAWDVAGDHRTVVRGHFGRYTDPQFTYLFAFEDTTVVNPTVMALVLGPGEFEEIDRFFWNSDSNTIAPSLKQSRVDQFSFGIEREVWRDFSLQGQYVHRAFRNFIGYVDPRLGEFGSFTFPDPGPDSALGTGDDGGVLTWWMPYPGERTFVLGNPSGAYRDYDALQAIARKRFSRRWQLEASYTWSRAKGTIDNAAHTNAAYWSLSPGGYGGTPWRRAAGAVPPSMDYSEAKVVGSYRAPWLGGFTIGGVYRWHTGQRWHRAVRITRPVFAFVPAEPLNSRRAPDQQSLDVRVEKTFRIPGQTWVAGVYVDVFNVANVGRATTVQGLSGPNFGLPSGWTDPRTARVGVRVSF